MRKRDLNYIFEVIIWILVGAFLFSLFQLLTACGGCVYQPPPDNPIDNDPSNCSAACDNLKRLGCPGWEGSPGKDEQFGTDDDVSCEDVCVDVVNTDPSVTLNQTCTADAESCDEVEACFDER